MWQQRQRQQSQRIKVEMKSCGNTLPTTFYWQNLSGWKAQQRGVREFDGEQEIILIKVQIRLSSYNLHHLAHSFHKNIPIPTKNNSPSCFSWQPVSGGRQSLYLCTSDNQNIFGNKELYHRCQVISYLVWSEVSRPNPDWCFGLIF